VKVYHYILFFLHARERSNIDPRRLESIHRVVNRLRWSVGFMLFSIVSGMLGYVFIEGYTWFEGYYMSVVTLSSVGFMEIHPLSHAGRVFTSLLILFNVGIFAYAISTITGIFAEGGLTRLLKDYRMFHEIGQLKGHTIVCGFGRHAAEVTRELSKQGKPFVVIENKPERVQELREQGQMLFLEGDATQDNILLEAGIDKAEALVITLPSDADNLFITLSARQLNPSVRIISRAQHRSDEEKLRRAGANYTVVPELIGGFYMANLVNNPDLVEFFSLISNMGPSQAVFEEIPVSALREPFRQQNIAASGLDRLARVSIVAFRYPDGRFELNPDFSGKLQTDWQLVLLGNAEQMEMFRKKALL
jgi:voltage-gated potassium channel